MDHFVIAQTVISTLLAAFIVWGVKKVSTALRGVAGRIDKLYGATQTTMRTTLIHNFEKYLTRGGWVTPEERASWCDMYEKYEGLGANGFIRSYRDMMDDMPDRPLSVMAGHATEGNTEGSNS